MKKGEQPEVGQEAPKEQPAEVKVKTVPKTPPVTEADFDRAVRLYVRGHYAETLVLLEKISEIKLSGSRKKQVNFLSGVTAYKLGNSDKVEKYMSRQGSIPASLECYGTYYRGRAFFMAGEYDRARSLLDRYIKMQPGGAFVNKARLTRAEALYYKGDKTAALNECRKLLKTGPSASVRLVMARMHEGLGQMELAKENYRQAMNNSRTREVRAEAAFKYKEFLLKSTDKPGREAEKYDLVRLLRREWRLDESLAMIEKLRAAGCSDVLKNRLSSEKALLLYFSGQNQKAAACYQGARSASGIRMYARSLRRTGQWQKAADAYMAAAKAYGSGKKAEQARLDAGLMYLRLGKHKEAMECWEAVHKRYREGSFKDDMLWHTAFYHYGRKEWGKAEADFREIVEELSGSKLKTASSYWLGRSLEQQGKKAQANVYYKKLAASKKDYYYRMRSEQRLGWIKNQDHWEDLPAFYALLTPKYPDQDYSALPLRLHKIEAVGTPAWANSDPGLSIGDLWTERKRLMSLKPAGSAKTAAYKTTIRLKDLAASGALDLAHMEADYLRRILKGTANNPGLKLRVFAFSSAYMAETGDYKGFVRLQYKHFSLLVKGKSEADRLLARRRFYPLAYPSQVLKAAREFHLHPALLMAVIRTESYYDPHIISVANAHGLMQILPSTGKKIASRIGQAEPHPEALFDPETNIRFGAWYLAALIKEFEGQLPLAIASYNGGPFNVKRWAKQSEECSLEEFIERIPFDQTRLYVKKILGHMYQYRLLFAGKAVGPDLSAPLRKVDNNNINF